MPNELAQPSETTAPSDMQPSATTDTRQRLLNAAWALAARAGFANLTLDAVAREAAVSKGGLLYHFPSKRALLEGMVENRCDQCEAQLLEFAERETGPGRWLRALIRAATCPQPVRTQDGAAAFALLANDPELLALVRLRRQAFQERIAGDGIDPVEAAIVRLAVDGICFNQIMDFGSPAPELYEQVVCRLLALAERTRQPSQNQPAAPAPGQE